MGIILVALMLGACGGFPGERIFEIEVENRSAVPAEIRAEDIERGVLLSDAIRILAGERRVVEFEMPSGSTWGLTVLMPADMTTVMGPDLVEAQEAWRRGELESAPQVIIEPNGEVHGTP